MRLMRRRRRMRRMRRVVAMALPMRLLAIKTT